MIIASIAALFAQKVVCQFCLHIQVLLGCAKFHHILSQHPWWAIGVKFLQGELSLRPPFTKDTCMLLPSPTCSDEIPNMESFRASLCPRCKDNHWINSNHCNAMKPERNFRCRKYIPIPLWTTSLPSFVTACYIQSHSVTKFLFKNLAQHLQQ
jgi:hypothetical protein